MQNVGRKLFDNFPQLAQGQEIAGKVDLASHVDGKHLPSALLDSIQKWRQLRIRAGDPVCEAEYHIDSSGCLGDIFHIPHRAASGSLQHVKDMDRFYGSVDCVAHMFSASSFDMVRLRCSLNLLLCSTFS